MGLTHSIVATGTDDPTKQVSKNAWNADHVLPEILANDNAPEADATIPAGHTAFIGEELAIADGMEVFIDDGAEAVLM